MNLLILKSKQLVRSYIREIIYVQVSHFTEISNDVPGIVWEEQSCEQPDAIWEIPESCCEFPIHRTASWTSSQTKVQKNTSA